MQKYKMVSQIFIKKPGLVAIFNLLKYQVSCSMFGDFVYDDSMNLIVGSTGGEHGSIWL